ncbi:FtsB family cell division protein [Tenggerimyces flavus]|uniref:Septum formation initiator family protein n=1 Tax=Tenggerimyces flavus TaxID=1708749 RepID=A0ABV7Y7X8_9ACTN|nr:septum formation initiator family protein [Tenggerimyces flavus]MBM7785683.1 cell division protein FtsB [Tenggerimyces flavus]
MPGPRRSPRPAARGRTRAGTSPGSPGRGARSGPERTRRTVPTDAPAGPPPAGPSGPSAAARRSSLTGRAAILALVLAALVVSYASSLRAWAEQRSQIAELKAEQADRTERVGELEDELNRWNDPAYIEAQARERFGWVLPGETGYKVVDETAGETAKPPTEKSSAKGNAARPWWSTLWGSVENAGNPPVPSAEPKKPKPAATIDPEVTPGQ